MFKKMTLENDSSSNVLLPTDHPKLQAFQSAVSQVLLRRIAEADAAIGLLNKGNETKRKERDERIKVALATTTRLSDEIINMQKQSKYST
jgi:hypothetical protein